MFKKNAVILAMFCSAALSVNAAEVSKVSDAGFYGEIDYAVNGDSLDGRDELGGSFFNFYTNYKTKDHIIINLDVGAKQRSEAVDVNSNDWDFNVNNLNIEYHDFKTNTYVVLGRQFTPIGINYDDPMKNNELFATENPFSSVMDGLNYAYDGKIEGIDLKASAFIGTRLDDVAITTTYGGNVKVGSKESGHFNFGYMNNKIDGNFIMNTADGSTVMTDNLDVINIGYLYDNHNVLFLADYNTLSHKDSVDDIDQLKTKLGYKLYSFLPYVSYDSSSYYGGNDLALHTTLDKYAVGLEYKMPKLLSLGAEFSREEGQSQGFEKIDEDVVRLYTKINF